MFVFPRRALIVAVVAVVFAGCGGARSGAVLPAARGVTPQVNGGGGIVSVSTLYVAGQGGVYAYDMAQLKAAAGNAAPISSTNGYYYQAAGPSGVTASIAGIATNEFGDLVVVQNYANPQGDGNSCQLVYVPARSAVRAADAFGIPCVNNNGTVPGLAQGVALTAGAPPSPAPMGAPTATSTTFKTRVNGFIYVLMHYQPSGDPLATACDDSNQDQYEVDRYVTNPDGGAGFIFPAGCTPLVNGTTSFYRAIAGGTFGTFFTDWDNGPGTPGTVERYDGSPALTNAATIPGQAGPLAVSANFSSGVGFRVVASTVNGQTTIYSFKVVNGCGAPVCGLTFTKALGTFGNAIGALAVDNDGAIYVGVNQPNGATKVKVYSAGKTEATDPDYILSNAVRRANPSASPAATITGLAIAQP